MEGSAWQVRQIIGNVKMWLYYLITVYSMYIYFYLYIHICILDIYLDTYMYVILNLYTLYVKYIYIYIYSKYVDLTGGKCWTM